MLISECTNLLELGIYTYKFTYTYVHMYNTYTYADPIKTIMHLKFHLIELKHLSHNLQKERKWKKINHTHIISKLLIQVPAI